MWLDPGIADLGLSGMARARYTLRTGRLLTKTQAITTSTHRMDRLAGHPRHAHLGLPRRTAGRGLNAVSGISARPLLRRSSALVLRFRHEMQVAGQQQFSNT